jgi:long-chain acyl-CoA synthetase
MQIDKKDLFHIFEERCHQFAMKQAVVLDGTVLTYQELLREVEAWEHACTDAGLQPGDRVLLMVDGYLAFIALWFALWKKRCIPIPIDVSFSPEERKKALHESYAQWLITSQSVEDMAEEIQERSTPALQANWCIARLDPQSLAFDGFDIALFFYTSGTTGSPKCVIFDRNSILANINDQIQAFQMSAADVCLTPLLPVLPSVLATIVWPALFVGATLVLLPGATPGQILKQVELTKTTVFYAVPYVYRLLATARKVRRHFSWGTIRLCLSSSAFLDENIFDEFYQQTSLPIHSLYCTSEAGACAYNDSEEPACLRSSVGKPFPNVKLQVVDSTGALCPPNTEGEILVSGPHLARGYLERRDLARTTFCDGWVATQDTGFFDEQGFLYITGRLGETINVSGYSVNPREVEQVLLSHPAVAEVLVQKQKDHRLGELVAAKVVLSFEVSIHELMQVCVAQLAHYKVPRRMVFVDELPKGRYGKMKRQVERE